MAALKEQESNGGYTRAKVESAEENIGKLWDKVDSLATDMAALKAQLATLLWVVPVVLSVAVPILTVVLGRVWR